MALISNVALLQLLTKAHSIPPHSHRIIQNTIIIDPTGIPRVTPRIARFTRQGIYFVQAWRTYRIVEDHFLWGASSLEGVGLADICVG